MNKKNHFTKSTLIALKYFQYIFIIFVKKNHLFSFLLHTESLSAEAPAAVATNKKYKIIKHTTYNNSFFVCVVCGFPKLSQLFVYILFHFLCVLAGSCRNDGTLATGKFFYLLIKLNWVNKILTEQKELRTFKALKQYKSKFTVDAYKWHRICCNGSCVQNMISLHMHNWCYCVIGEIWMAFMIVYLVQWLMLL